MYYIGEMEKWKKKAKINLGILVFFPTIHMVTLNVYAKFDDSGSHRSQEICDKTFDRREEKWSNKGNDKQEEADSLLHNTTCHTQCCTKF